MSSLKPALTAAALALATALPASADPSFGIGLSLVFGGTSQPQFGVGLRAFSTDEEDKGAVSLGVDYLFASQNWRPTIGAAYLSKNSYLGIDVGYGLYGAGVDFGVSGGFVDTKDPAPIPGPV